MIATHHPEPENRVFVLQSMHAQWAALHRKLSTEISPYSLAVFRIVFGALMVYDVIRYIVKDWITSKYVEPIFFFTYDGFAFLAPLPEPWIHIVWGCVGISAILIMIGAVYRFALAMFILTYGYFFLLDKAQYMNHHYMVLLFAILLICVPAHAAWSVDAKRKTIGPVLLGHKTLMVLQIEIILITAGLVKLSSDWMHLEPLRSWLLRRQDEVFYGALFQHDWIIAFGAYSAIALHLIGAPLLLWKRTRIWVFFAYVMFHFSNAQLFKIGIFPFLTIGATTLLFASDWPLKFVRQRDTSVAPGHAKSHILSRAFMAFLIIWTSLQILIPWRHTLYNNEVRWTDQGHRYSWRMKLLDRDTTGYFSVQNNTTEERWDINPRSYLSRRQNRKMLARPDMIVQFAQYIESEYLKFGYTNVSVYAHIQKSVNGRPYEDFVNSQRDLTDIRVGLFMPMDWLNNPGPTLPLR